MTWLPRQIVHADKWGFYLAAAFALFFCLWWAFIPVRPGCALAASGLVAAVAILRSDRASTAENAIWLLMAAALITAEWRVAKTYHEAEKTFLLCHFAQDGSATIMAVGPTALHAVIMRVVDQFALETMKVKPPADAAEYETFFQKTTLGTLIPSTQRQVKLLPLQVHAGVTRYRATFDADNGYSWEDFQSQLQNGRMVQAYRVSRYKGSRPQVLFEYDSPDFPRRADGVDWSWAAEEP